jgi:hypothetical protein
MIGHFPAPLPDELLYSICARFSDRVKYRNKEAVMTELFGRRGGAASIELPSRLSHLAANLPYVGDHCRRQFIERVIEKHTLFPVYRPFLPSTRCFRVKDLMAGSNGSTIYNEAGITPATLNLPDWLRFCPACVENDRHLHGKCYWHRLHQVTGVEVCPIHNLFLTNSSARRRNRENKSLFISAEHAVNECQPRPLSLTNRDHRALVQIARDINWLLNEGALVEAYSSLRDRYQLLLQRHNLLTKDHKVSLRKLVPLIRSKYSKRLLKTLQCNFDETKDYSWPFLLITHLLQKKADPPIRHLLLIQLLGTTTESFFSAPLKPSQPKTIRKPNANPFGRGPWSCLNPVCAEFRKRGIKTCLVLPHHADKLKVTGTFACKCGFTYKKLGPDKFAESSDHFIILRRGKVWESYLRKAWSDSSKSVRAIARSLNVKWDVVKEVAIILDLPFPRKGPTHSVLKVGNGKRRVMLRANTLTFDQIRANHRARFLGARTQHPTALRKQLYLQFVPASYQWLLKYDKQWLVKNSPPAYRRKGSARTVDWQLRDTSLSREIYSTASTLRDTSEVPRRITIQAIARSISLPTSLKKKSLSKLPLTTKALQEVTEGVVDFAVRKIEWAAAELAREPTPIGLYSLRMKATINHELWYVPQIKTAFDKALDFLIDVQSQ